MHVMSPGVSILESLHTLVHIVSVPLFFVLVPVGFLQTLSPIKPLFFAQQALCILLRCSVVQLKRLLFDCKFSGNSGTKCQPRRKLLTNDMTQVRDPVKAILLTAGHQVAHIPLYFLIEKRSSP